MNCARWKGAISPNGSTRAPSKSWSFISCCIPDILTYLLVWMSSAKADTWLPDHSRDQSCGNPGLLDAALSARRRTCASLLAVEALLSSWHVNRLESPKTVRFPNNFEGLSMRVWFREFILAGSKLHRSCWWQKLIRTACGGFDIFPWEETVATALHNAT